MNTTLISTLTTTPFITLDQNVKEYDFAMIIIILAFGCPILCYIYGICLYNGCCLYKRKDWRTIYTPFTKEEISRLNDDYYNGA